VSFNIWRTNHTDVHQCLIVARRVPLPVGSAMLAFSAESVKKVNEITTRLGNDIIKKE
jgi:hypothetical protein